MSVDEYADRFEHIRLTRQDGVLEVALHSDGGPLVWGAGVHAELPAAFAAIASDERNRVVLLTGTGDDFCAQADASMLELTRTARGWGRIHREGRALIESLLGIEVPVIAAVNGPARVHAEIAILADVVLAAEHAYFQDVMHVRRGVVPGDGVQVVWPMLLGPNRGRYFLLTGEKIPAAEARALGIVGEVLAPAALMPRARELAAGLAGNTLTMLRHTRMALVGRLRRELVDATSHGLALEALASLEET
jgi:6-oxocamphor hydrolase